MVYFEDLGAMIDAPVTTVWEYLLSEDHGGAHSGSARNFQVKETVGSTSVISGERFFNGKWSAFLTKSTDFPPFCICNEEVQGDFAGTKFVLVYRPRGSQTQVDVFGDIQSNAFDAESARSHFLKLLEGAHNDDVAAIAVYRKKRSR